MKKILLALALALGCLTPTAWGGKHAAVPIQAPLYAVGSGTLFRMDRKTGQLTPISDLRPGIPYNPPQLGYDRNHHFLYGFGYGGGGSYFAIDVGNGNTNGPYTIVDFPTYPETNIPAFSVNSFAYNPWNDHIYLAAVDPFEDGFLFDIDPNTWTTTQETAIASDGPFNARSGTFDEWTGYLLFWTGGGLRAVDPGTGHVPGSLEKYPIPQLSGYFIASITIDPQSADIYFVGRAYADPSETTYLYRAQRSTGHVFAISAAPDALSIAFGESPLHLK